MTKMKCVIVFIACLSSASLLAGQQVVDSKDAAHLDAEREKHALQSLSRVVEKEITSAVDAMPADKFGFAPTDGEFKGVRTFGEMVKHLSATNHILAAAALGEEPPADAGDELGPEDVRTKAEILTYLKGSFAHLDKAIEAVGQANIPVNASPISPLKRGEVTRVALIAESWLHAYDHYGQMIEYLRMNGVVPPTSRP
ncbi:MAG TPA: DinB family protein [Terriglobales bacterium]